MMAQTAYKEYSLPPADPERLENLLSQFAADIGADVGEVKVSVSYAFADGSSDIRSIEPSAVATLVPIARPKSLIVFRPGLRWEPNLYIYIGTDRVGVQASADPMSFANALVEKAVTTLGLEPYTATEERTRMTSLERRLVSRPANT